MSKKLYYKSLYAALYMIENFDVKIIDWVNNETGEIHLLNNSASYKFDDYAGPRADKYYISQESLHLYEPQDGDIGIAQPDGLPIEYDGGAWRLPDYYYPEGLKSVTLVARKYSTFIQPLTEETI